MSLGFGGGSSVATAPAALVMISYLVRRLLALIPVMAVVVTIVFLLIHLIPGDPVAVMLGPDATPAQIDATRAHLGLDRPLLEQLLLFYKRILRGDLGPLLLPGPAGDAGAVGAGRADAPADGASLLVALLIGVPSGIVAGANQGSWWDRLLMLGALLGVCIPGFWLSLNFIYLFAVRLGLAAGRGLRVDLRRAGGPPSATWSCPRSPSASTSRP